MSDRLTMLLLASPTSAVANVLLGIPLFLYSVVRMVGRLVDGMLWKHGLEKCVPRP